MLQLREPSIEVFDCIVDFSLRNCVEGPLSERDLILVGPTPLIQKYLCVTLVRIKMSNSVSDILGFQPSELLGQVSDIVDKEVDACVDKIKRELLKSNEAKRKDSTLTEQSLEKVIVSFDLIPSIKYII